jgi:hypothetical protein
VSKKLLAYKMEKYKKSYFKHCISDIILSKKKLFILVLFLTSIPFFFHFFFITRMSTDDVSVSLSRLALAKAIKTPDSGEDDAEPWSKSIIFHQAHIDPQMRYSIEHPQHQQQQQHNRRRGLTKNTSHGRHSHVYPLQQQETKRLVTPPMHRARSDEMHKHKQPATERLSSHSASSGSAGRSSLSSTKLSKEQFIYILFFYYYIDHLSIFPLQ